MQIACVFKIINFNVLIIIIVIGLGNYLYNVVEQFKYLISNTFLVSNYISDTRHIADVKNRILYYMYIHNP